MSQYPPLEVFDENDEVVGQASLDDIFRQALIHRISMILVREPGGKILLQRRGPNVATNPDKWDISAAGYVDASESYSDSAIRELHEELGIDKADLTEAAYYFSDRILDGKHLRRFIKIYVTTLPIDTEFSLEPEEVTEVRWFDIDELAERFRQHPEEFNDDLAVSLGKLNIKI